MSKGKFNVLTQAEGWAGVAGLPLGLVGGMAYAANKNGTYVTGQKVVLSEQQVITNSQEVGIELGAGTVAALTLAGLVVAARLGFNRIHQQ